MSDETKKQVVDAGTEFIDILIKLGVGLCYGLGYIIGSLFQAFNEGFLKGKSEQAAQEKEAA